MKSDPIGVVFLAAGIVLAVLLTACAQNNPPPQPDVPIHAKVIVKIGDHIAPAKVIGPQRPDGCWDVITAWSDQITPGAKGTIMTTDGKSYEIVVEYVSPYANIMGLVTTKPTMDFLP